MSHFLIDHTRASVAYTALDTDLKREPELLKKYRSVVRGAPTYVRQMGLLQTLAFWTSKKGDAEKLLVKHLITWLCHSQGLPHIKLICGETRGATARAAITYDPMNPVKNFVGPLLERSSRELAMLAVESENYLGWLGRFTEGIYLSSLEGDGEGSANEPSIAKGKGDRA